mgnify:FL=1
MFPGTALTVDQYGGCVMPADHVAKVRQLLADEPDGAVLAAMLGVA